MKSLSIPRRPHGRIAVNVAVWLLGAMLIGQVVAMGWALHRKKQQALGVAERVAEAGNAVVPSAPEMKVPDEAFHFDPQPSALTVPVMEKETEMPSVPELAETKITDERVLFFLDNALVRRDKGDMKAALTHLRAACDLLPENPRLLYELANTYEAMTLHDKAAPIWDQIFRQGESAGIYFRIAQSKFEQGDAKQPREIEVPLQLGKILEQRSTRDTSLSENVTLRIPVQARDGAVIDPGKVSVVTQFYDISNGSVEESTLDNTRNYRWLSGEFPSWTTNSVEFLDQTYQRPKMASMAPFELEEEPRYHGYVVKLYYDNHLQDVKAWPEQLATRQSEPGERGLLLPTNHPPQQRQPASRQLDDSLFPLPQ